MNILIVDDDMLIRNWLTLFIRRDEPEVGIYSAGDALEALEICRSTPIDLVITDINMPKRSGVQLIEDLSVEFPRIHTAVLSAYDNYEYIRPALRYGALDYILKSDMKAEDVTALLKKVRLTQSRQEDLVSPEKLERQKRFRSEMARFINDSVSAPDPRALFGDRCPDLSNLTVLTVQFSRDILSDTEDYRIREMIENDLSGCALEGTAFRYGTDRYFILYEPRAEYFEERKADDMKLLLLLQRNLQSLFSIRIAGSARSRCTRPEELRTALLNNLYRIEAYSYYQDARQIQDFGHIGNEEMMSLYKDIRSSVISKEYRSAFERIAETLRDFHSRFVLPKDIKSVMSYLCTILFSNISVNSPDNTFTSDYMNIIRSISGCRDPSEMTAAVDRSLSYFAEHFQKKTTPMSPATRKVIEYIDENYSSRIQLNDIASSVFLNKTYLCHLFKKQVGIGINEYLENVRINKSKELLATSDANITQVAVDVGYSSQSYFTKVFRKKIGMSPSYYRSLVSVNPILAEPPDEEPADPEPALTGE